MFPASIGPPTVITEVDSVFTVELRAELGAAQFNAYDVTLFFDPAILEFEAVTEGPLMLSGCGNTFKVLNTTDSTVAYSHSLLCAGVSLDGPGILSSYRFRAVGNGISPIEFMSSPDSSFFDAGIFVSPVHPSRPRQVTWISTIVAVGSDPTASPSVERSRLGSLRVWPNPIRESGEVHFELASAGWARLDILDVSGRRVLSRSWDSLGPGVHRTEWATRDATGRPLPGGFYFVRITDARGGRTAKITLLR